MNTQTLDSHWQEISGKLRERWSSLNENELQQAKGDVQRLIRTIQQKTGETREAVQAFLDETAGSFSGTAQQAAEAIRDYAGRAAESVQQATEQASQSVRAGVRQTRQMVRRHPMESLLTCFGAGVVTGLVVGILVRSSR